MFIAYRGYVRAVVKVENPATEYGGVGWSQPPTLFTCTESYKALFRLRYLDELQRHEDHRKITKILKEVAKRFKSGLMKGTISETEYSRRHPNPT